MVTVNETVDFRELFLKTLTPDEKRYVIEWMSGIELAVGDGAPFHKAVNDMFAACKERHPGVTLTKNNLLFTCYFWKYGPEYASYVRAGANLRDTKKDIVVSTHASRRMKQRMNIKKSAQEKIARDAFTSGIKSEDRTSATVKSFINGILDKNYNGGDKKESVTVSIFKGGVFIFKKEKSTQVLVTAYQAPKYILAET